MGSRKNTSLLDNGWDNVYWFARMLINNDKYGGVGKETNLLQQITASVRTLLENEKSAKVALALETIKTLLQKRFHRSSAKQERVSLLIADLAARIQSIFDVNVFLLTCEHVMIPLNQALANIPSNDREFTQNMAEAYLNVNGEKGLATIIRIWDDLGTHGCLNAERTEIIRAFTALRTFLAENDIEGRNADTILTAFTQEFERRAAQKRKGRAGGSLEDVTDFVLAYHRISTTEAPAHFQADIEVDNWVKTSDGWLIAISCKRTLRERWKQVSSADASILSKFKIKYLFHIVTYDEDLSDEKLALLGGQRHVFYLADESRTYKRAREHVGLEKYVRPLSKFIVDIKKEIG